MRHSQLRAFHHVALHGGFSRAAEVLHQTQPSISEQVRRLEQAYDVLLFRRDRKQVDLTAQGAALFRLTRRYFEAEEAIAAQLTASRAAISGTLRIIADSAHHITGALRAFRSAHPEVFISLRSGNSDQVLAALRNYDAEIGVLGSLDAAPDLDMIDLGATPILAVAARASLPVGTAALSLDQLAGHPVILREKGSRTRAAIEAAARQRNVRLTAVIEAEGREAMREVVASGAGIGFVSEAEFGNDSRLIKLPLEQGRLRMTETLVVLRMRREVPVIRAFLRAVADTAPDPGP